MPNSLPAGSMLIFNDRTPPRGHDHQLITAQLSELVDTLQCSSVLLDFQRPDFAENEAVAKAAMDTIPCPVGVSELYAKELDCPVFLPPVPLTMPIDEYLSPWKNREIWLEAAMIGQIITVTDQGTALDPVPLCAPTENAHFDKDLCCHYTVKLKEDRIIFTLQRTFEAMELLLQNAESHGVRLAVGLYQELRAFS